MELLAAGAKPGAKCCKQGEPGYERLHPEAKASLCKECPNKPSEFHPFFFHIQSLAMRQESGLPLSPDQITRLEMMGLSIWNTFHDGWRAVGYRTLKSTPKDQERA